MSKNLQTKLRWTAIVFSLFMIVGMLVACESDDECSHQWGEWSVKTQATCTDVGTQERRCSDCGETETSSIDALGHTWKEATCVDPKTCTTCQATEGAVVAHTGGSATCKDKAECSVCGTKYGDLAAHTPNADDGDCTTEITCSVCGEVTTEAKANHSGGIATCKDKAKCATCGKEYGEIGTHTPIADDGDCTTAITCSACGEIITAAKVTHTGGTATCKDKAKCAVCGKEYGNLKTHTPNADDGDCTTAIDCSVCGEVTTAAKASHTGGTATCKNKAKCTICGKEYGSLKAHTPNADDGDCTTAITCSVCGKVTTAAKASHTGGTATCQHKAECAICGKEYGSYGTHSYNETVWGYQATDGHAHMCSVAGCNAHDTIVSHTSSGAATETTAEKCTKCGYVINPATGHKTHTPATAWTSNATHHWHECVGCEDQEFNKAEHTYDDACDTTCNVCGYKRTVTHSYTDLKQDGDNHWYECATCHATKPNSKEAHKGGTATCKDKAKCIVCGKEYGNLATHIPNADDGDCTTAITCSVCNTVTTSAKTDHTGGTATCKDKAKCSVCGKAYGNLASHTPSADDGDCTTAITCSVCGTITTPAKANHTGGTATCKDKAKCAVCGKEYGNLKSHTPNKDDGDCTTAITCSVCGTVTTAAKNHTGGTATCKDKAKCIVCGKEYGNLATHTPDADDGNCTTAINCSVCGTVVTAAKTHVFDNACDTDCNNANCNHTRTTTHTPKADDGDCTTAITCSVCGTITTPAKADHTGGTATCKNKAKCTICGKEYGSLKAHTPSADDGDCTTAITCSVCGTVTTPARANHTGGTATCKDKAECTVCGKEYGNFASHSPKADDGDCTTAITCSVCGTITTPAKANHTGGTATCKDKAECTVCGKEYGDLKAHTPNADDCDCTTAITCSICGTVTTSAKANHTGGTATCKDKAKCTVCGKEYGNLKAHTPNADDGDCTTAITCSVCGTVTTTAKTHAFDNACDTNCNNANCNHTRTTTHSPNADDGDCTTAITCSVCAAVTTPAKANHTGGTATCKDKAKCSVCGKAYGNLASHTPKADDGDCTTAITCSVCGAVTTPAKANHTGGTATCKDKAKCSACGKEYGNLKAHTPRADDGDCTTAITCSVCGAVTTPAKANHTGGTATCKDKAKCTVCGKEYGNLKAHTPNADDGDCTTAITCSVCGEITTPAKASHTGGTATCKDKANCSVCGKEYGNLASHKPNADDGDCTTAIKCSVCGTVTTPAKSNHTGGKATCKDKAKCTVCGKEYGNLASHTPNADDGNCATAITCSVCGTIITPAKNHVFDDDFDADCNNDNCEHTREVSTTPTFIVSSASARAGDTIDVAISIKNNPGIAGAKLTVTYNSKLTLISAVEGSALEAIDYTAPANLNSGCAFNWDSLIGEATADGTVILLTFKVSDDVSVGDILEITCSYVDGDIYDENIEDVSLDCKNGSVTIK